MLQPTFPNNLTTEELIVLAEKKYAELLKADAELEVLKPLRLQIKKLRSQSSLYQTDNLSRFS